MTDTESRLRDLVADQLCVENAGRIAPDAAFHADLGADSLDTVELAMVVEDEFRIVLTDDEAHAALGEGARFADLCALVARKRAEAVHG